MGLSTTGLKAALAERLTEGLLKFSLADDNFQHAEVVDTTADDQDLPNCFPQVNPRNTYRVVVHWHLMHPTRLYVYTTVSPNAQDFHLRYSSRPDSLLVPSTYFRTLGAAMVAYAWRIVLQSISSLLSHALCDAFPVRFPAIIIFALLAGQRLFLHVHFQIDHLNTSSLAKGCMQASQILAARLLTRARGLHQ